MEAARVQFVSGTWFVFPNVPVPLFIYPKSIHPHPRMLSASTPCNYMSQHAGFRMCDLVSDILFYNTVQCGEQRNFLRNRLSGVSFNVLGDEMYIHIHVFFIFHLCFIELLLHFVLGFITDRKEGDLEESCSSCSPKMKNRTLWTVEKSESKDNFTVRNVGYFSGLLSVSHPNSNILK